MSEDILGDFNLKEHVAKQRAEHIREQSLPTIGSQMRPPENQNPNTPNIKHKRKFKFRFNFPRIPESKPRSNFRQAVQQASGINENYTPYPTRRQQIQRERNIERLKFMRAKQLQQLQFLRMKAIQDTQLKEQQRNSLKLQNVDPLKVAEPERTYNDSWIFDHDLISGRKTLRKRLGAGNREAWLG